ncbi:fibronectin type III domain-containing protein [uncultured Flavobacterium sp.]|uniref:fibronectin type III domain-containing protein n=1 Tax=uncultured Flavobacterium sp. TaxID=165435 RepID=UPI0027E10507|nr:fibronectin type III domain-containing protein [uncultured Flavobacterium sp.]
MKTKITFLYLLALICFIQKVSAQCTYGSLTSSQAITPVYDNNERIIFNGIRPGEYLLIKTFSTATRYTFKSTRATDYITIADANGAQVFVSGLSGSNGLNFTPPYPQTIRYYIHTGSQCESGDITDRQVYLKTTTIDNSCDSPNTLSVSNITSNSCKVSWNAQIIGQITSYDVYVNTTGISPVTNTIPTTEANGSREAQVSGLAPNTTHYYWVRTQCVSDRGVWVPGGSFTTTASGTGTAGCNGAPFGLYPEATVNVTCNGSVQQIAADAHAGEYTNVYVTPNEQYTFTSSVSTDFITITDPTGATIYASGQTPLVWVNNSNWATIRYYLHTNSSCGTQNTARIKSIKCGGVVGGCTVGELHPQTTFTPACSGSLEMIVNDAYAGEYSNVNVTANKQYTFSSSNVNDYITIANPVGNAAIATGPSPLVWNSGSTSGVIRYYIHTNSSCGTQNINRQRYIKCTAAEPTCGVPTALSVSNITSNSSRLSWTAPATAPTSYDLYIVTANTAPTANTAATVTSTTAGVDVLSGLEGSTTYYYWIRSNCGSTKSAWVSGGNFTTIAALNCNGAIYGLYPNATFTPACTGTNEPIATDCWAGEYSNVNVVANKQYTFTSSVATDYITITNAAGTTVLASGVTPLNWTSGSTTGVVRYHLNTNASCGTANTNRTRSVKCVDAPTGGCGVPSALSVTNITSNSIRLNWTAPATAPASYDIYIVTTNTAPNANTAATVTSTTAGVGVLRGLDASTTYYYWIRSNCGGTKSAWVSGGSFTTIAALNCNGATNGLYPNATFTPACTGANEQIVADAWAGEYSNVNIMDNKQYTFTSSVATDYITITNANGTVVLASGVTPLNWSSGSTSGVVRYHLNTNANCGTANTDRVRSIKCVDATPSCGAPSNLSVTDVTSNSARIIWTAPTPAPMGYDLYVVQSNTAPTANSNPTHLSSTNSRLITGLSPATNYNYWVRANCGSTRGNWVYGGSFDAIPAVGCNGAIYGSYPTETLQLACTGSPQIVAEGLAGQFTKMYINFGQYYVFSSSIATDYITITDDNGMTVLASGTTPLSWSSGSNVGVIRFYVHSNANCGAEDAIRIKSVNCSSTPIGGCGLPSNVSVSNVTSNSALIRWTAPSPTPSSGYDLYVVQSNTAPTYNSTPTHTVSNNYTSMVVSGLSPATNYSYWIRANCGSTKGDWVYGGSFDAIPAVGCNGATFGPNPAEAIQIACMGSAEVVSQGFAGEFTNIYINYGQQYTFSTSVATDYITITDDNGMTVLASGPSPLNWSSGSNVGVIRYYVHTNANCGSQDAVRVKSVTCRNPLGIDQFAQNNVTIYPNPSYGQFTVETGSVIADNITITDNLGRVITTFKPSLSKSDLSIDSFAEGIYYVKIDYQNKSVTKKLALKKN